MNATPQLEKPLGPGDRLILDESGDVTEEMLAAVELSTAAAPEEAPPPPKGGSPEWWAAQRRRLKAERKSPGRRSRHGRLRQSGARNSYRPQEQLRALPMPGARLRFLVQVESYLELEEELYVLGALTALRRSQPSLCLGYATRRPEVAALLTTQSHRPVAKPSVWFLEQVQLLADGAEPAGEWDEMLTLSEPEALAAHEEEERRARSAYDREVAQLQATKAFYDRMGMKDIQVPIPEYQFVPRWHKGHAYLWQLSEQLGIPLAVPSSLKPFAQAPAQAQRGHRAELQASAVLKGRYLLFDFAEEPEVTTLTTTLAHQFPSLRLIAANRFKTGDTWNLGLLLAALGHEQCVGAVLPNGPGATLAWALAEPKTPLPLLQLYRGANSRWDGAGGDAVVLSRDQYAAQLPQALAQAIQEWKFRGAGLA